MAETVRLLVTRERLDPRSGHGSFESIVANPGMTGALDDFTFCAANGRQVLLGHHPYGADELTDGWTDLKVGGWPAVNTVFMTKDVVYQRHATTWEEIRALLTEGYVFGTAKHPNIKVWVAGTWRNGRLAPDRIFVVTRLGRATE